MIIRVTDDGNTASFASEGSDGTSQLKRIVAVKAPRSCAAINPGASTGRIPAKYVCERTRERHGRAKDVEAVNQYAPVM
jgi:hypothetical protein